MILDREKIGCRMKESRKQKGLTQEKLAEKLEFNNRTVNLMENGKCGMTIETLIKLCNILEVSPNYLLCYKSTENTVIDEIHNFTPPQLEIVKELLVNLRKFNDLNNK